MLQHWDAVLLKVHEECEPESPGLLAGAEIQGRLERLKRRNKTNEVTLVNPRSGEYAAMMPSIWPEPYASPAAEAFAQDWNSGQIFLIQAPAGIVGTTGFFLEPGVGLVYLRWTGVLPAHRNKGYAKEALVKLREWLHWPLEGRKLVELVPDNEYGAPVKEFFLKQGFIIDSEVHVPSNECSDWPVVPMSIVI